MKTGGEGVATPTPPVHRLPPKKFPGGNFPETISLFSERRVL